MELPHPSRIRLVKLAAEWRPKAKHVDSRRMHHELSTVVFDYVDDKDGNPQPVYLQEFQRAAIVSYAYCWHPTKHDMHTV